MRQAQLAGSNLGLFGDQPSRLTIVASRRIGEMEKGVSPLIPLYPPMIPNKLFIPFIRFYSPYHCITMAITNQQTTRYDNHERQQAHLLIHCRLLRAARYFRTDLLPPSRRNAQRHQDRRAVAHPG